MTHNDKLVWHDGSWCFRWEFTQEDTRDDNYRVLAYQSDEWHEHDLTAYKLKSE